MDVPQKNNEYILHNLSISLKYANWAKAYAFLVTRQNCSWSYRYEFRLQFETSFHLFHCNIWHRLGFIETKTKMDTVFVDFSLCNFGGLPLRSMRGVANSCGGILQWWNYNRLNRLQDQLQNNSNYRGNTQCFFLYLHNCFFTWKMEAIVGENAGNARCTGRWKRIIWAIATGSNARTDSDCYGKYGNYVEVVYLCCIKKMTKVQQFYRSLCAQKWWNRMTE